jgi:glucan phosphoethanolaminetransferase (alkaline phosphatase superfamily)
MSLLDRRDWVYLLSLLVPLVAYDLALKLFGLASGHPGSGVWDALQLLRSNLLFDAGYVLVWIALFAVARRGIPRRVVLVLLHASAILVVVIATVAYQYFRSTGTALDYGMVSYYLAKPGEAQGAVSSDAPMGAWLVLSAALLYSLPGPLLLTRALLPIGASGGSAGNSADAEGEEVPRRSRTPRRALTRQEFLSAGVGAAGVFLLKESLLPEEAGAESSFSRDPVSNLVATELEQSRLEEAAKNARVRHPLAKARLKPTPRTRRRHVALIHLESTRERSVTPYVGDIETTPYLAALANDSLLVERAYTTITHTSQAITSVNSGLYPSPATDIVEAQPGGIPDRCLAELLDEQGYKSAWFQSAEQTFENRPQLVKNFGYQYQAYEESMNRRGFQKANYLGYEDDIMLNSSKAWLEENANSPTLVTYLGVTPHDDYRPIYRYGRKNFSSRAMLDRYLNNIYYDDFWVKNIVEQYKRLGLYEDTIFVIYGDHGEAFGEHGVYHHDGAIWEEGLRVPLIIHDPQRFDGGERIQGPAHHLDLAPSIVDMLGYELVDGEYPGRTVFSLPEDRTLFFGCRPDLLSVARIQGQQKYIYHFGNRPEEYYDLKKDPLEKNNLIGKVGEKGLDRFHSEALAWHADATAAYPKTGSS